jgi:hypothetical protein
MANIPILVLVWTISISWYMAVNVMAQQGSPTTTAGTPNPSQLPASIQDDNDLDSCFLEFCYYDSNDELQRNRSIVTCELDNDPLVAPASCTMDYGASSGYQEICLNELDGKFYFQYSTIVCTKASNNTTTYPVTYNFLNNPNCFPQTCSDDNIDALSQRVFSPILEQDLSTSGSICDVKAFGFSSTILTSQPPLASPVMTPTNQDDVNNDDSCYINLLEIETMYLMLNGFNTEPIVDCIFEKNRTVASSKCTVEDDPSSASIQQLCLNEISGQFFFHNFTLHCNRTTTNGTEYVTLLNYSKSPLCFPLSCTEDDINAIITDYHYNETEIAETGDIIICESKDGVLDLPATLMGRTNNTNTTGTKILSPSSVPLSSERNMTGSTANVPGFRILIMINIVMLFVGIF